MASPVDMKCVSVERGVLAKYPLAFYFGHDSPSANPQLFKKQVDALAKVADQCLSKNQVCCYLVCCFVVLFVCL